MKHSIFYTAIATLFTHELDAMTHHEWRVLPLTAWLPDEHGMMVFVLFHIPLFAVLIALVASRQSKIRNYSRIGIGLFLIVHGLLHVLFMGTPHYEFTSLVSNGLIFGGAALGGIYLGMEYADKSRV